MISKTLAVSFAAAAAAIPAIDDELCLESADAECLAISATEPVEAEQYDLILHNFLFESISKNCWQVNTALRILFLQSFVCFIEIELCH